MQSATDWHSEDIKAAIRKTGVTLTALSVAAGFSPSAVRTCLLIPIPRVQAAIARHLGKRPQDIWPSRYDAAGRPLKGLHAGVRSNRSAPAPTPHRQKSEAA
jgi:Ner family transcriptional regulator